MPDVYADVCSVAGISDNASSGEVEEKMNPLNRFIDIVSEFFSLYLGS